jgi:hypothetical protein
VCPYDHIWNLYTDLRYTEISSSKKKDRNGKQKTKNFIVIDRVKKSDGYLDDDGHFQFLLFKKKIENKSLGSRLLSIRYKGRYHKKK